jgi:predicted TIM-barrel fold metal-dependent hydrolase
MAKKPTPWPVLLLAAALVAVVGALAWRAVDDRPPPPPQKSKKASPNAARAYFDVDDPAISVDQLPPRKFKVIDVHEHVLDRAHAEKMLVAMDALSIARACLMGTSTYTFTLDKKYGFEGWQENNREILAIKRWKPDRFSAFVTLDPTLPDALATLRQAVHDGADGLKLYAGHGESHGKGSFHQMPLDDPRLDAIYAYAEQIDLPIVYHVNLIKYWDEFSRAMQKHPRLRVDVPHFGLHKTTQDRLDKLSTLLRTYPNLYTDVSFGWVDFHREGFESLAGNRERSRRFFAAHADKILFASDMVLEPTKDAGHSLETMRSYLQLLEMEKFRFMLQPDKPMHGLALDDGTLKKIYEDAPKAFLRLDEKGMPPDLTSR